MLKLAFLQSFTIYGAFVLHLLPPKKIPVIIVCCPANIIQSLTTPSDSLLGRKKKEKWTR